MPLLLTVAALTALPSVAQAATKPVVTTGGTSNVVQQSARISGSVDPNGAATTYFFQYGTTASYGTNTPPLVVTGDGKRSVSVDIAGLNPATKYHYRITARNNVGDAFGPDRTFTTPKQPLEISLTSTPNPVPFGGSTVFSGQVTGTGNGGVPVALQANPFPYTQGFQQVGNAVIADATGGFAIPLLGIPFTTQYRAVQVGKALTSNILTVGVASRVKTNVSSYRVKRNRLVTFSGTLKPALPGTLMAVQKRDSKGRWVLIGGMAARKSNSTQAKFKRRVRVYSAGTYRVYAGSSDGRYVPSLGREIRIRLR